MNITLPPDSAMIGIEKSFVEGRFNSILKKHFEFPIYRRMLRRGGIELSDKVILDAGCGPGHGLFVIDRELSPKGLYGIDIDPAEVSLARSRNAPGKIKVGDVADLPFPDNTFDAVFVFTVLHHMLRWRKALKEINRVLNPRGLLLLNEHHKRSLYLMDMVLRLKHPPEARFDWNELEEGIEKAHFSILDRKIIFGILGFYLCQKLP